MGRSYPKGDTAEAGGEVDLNPQFLLALELMERTERNVFITGRAGTGKSTLLRYFREHSAKPVVVLAPTGVAAVTAGGQTIHSFFGFKPDITPSAIRRRVKGEKADLYRRLKIIIIDEVSMVRADLLDCMDRFLRLNGPAADRPFGGVQMIFIGDLYQLPPVVTSREKEIFRSHYATPFFFSARAFEDFELAFVELETVYRQKDPEFIRLLNAIRNRSITDEDLVLLNRRVDPAFEAPAKSFYINLTSTNDLADRINEEQLSRLPGDPWTAVAAVDGDFEDQYLPTSPVLKLKKGAQIMLLNNDSLGRWINGTIGKLKGVKPQEEGPPLLLARLDNGRKVEIAPYTWEIFRFFLKDGEIASEAVGSFMQYPVRLAFAVTIHKSQGKTFRNAVVDVGRGTFAHGQMYVALSRCTDLDGLVLRKPVRRSHILMDWQVVNFLTRFQYGEAARRSPREERVAILEEAVRERKKLEIVYLKAKDEKSRRTVRPLFVGEMTFSGRPFLGLEAHCLMRDEKRTFNVDRILEIREVP
ncbi:MAG TPA: AAA family ATPase [Syntrophales bacterium]|nr:AAA family ATPase [Syntrophales bacterium]